MFTVPDWLNHDFLYTVFVKDKLDDIANWRSEIVPFVKKHQHMAIDLFNIKFVNRTNPDVFYHAFVKVLSENSSNDFGTSLSIQKKKFQREGDVYRDIFPHMKELLDRIGEQGLKFPKLYYYMDDPPVLILEDMVAQGYESYSEKYNFDDYKNVMDRIAIFHAASYFLDKTEKMNLSNYKLVHTLEGDLETNVPLLRIGYQMFQEAIETWNGCEEFAEKMKIFEPHFTQELAKSRSENPSGINVLSHGDVHRDNFIFRNNRKEVLPLDYQICTWSSPASDILSVINAICEIEDIPSMKEPLIRHYHAKFRTVLQKLGFCQVIPSLLDVQVELVKHGILNLVAWCYLTPFIIMKGTKDDHRETKVKLKEALIDPRMQQLSKLFPDFLSKGYLDV